MAIEQFSALLQDKVYKDWLKKANKNIVTASAQSLRTKEQAASKTSFYITEGTVQKMYKTITGIELDSFEAALLLEEIRLPTAANADKTLVGTTQKVSGQNAVFFKNIGFDTITTKLTQALSMYPEVALAYEQAEQKYYDTQSKLITSSAEYQSLKPNEKQQKLDDISKEAKRRASFGFYFNKGHVVSVAANLARQFKQDIEKANKLADSQRKLLVDVLDKYINKLIQDDLNTANLPDALNQTLYAEYIKSSDKYLVEIQVATENIEAGASSIPIVKELRDLFSGKIPEQALLETLKSSKSLGEALVSTDGSPSLVKLIEADIVDILSNNKPKQKVYKSPRAEIGSNSLKLVKPKKNTAKINKLKSLKTKTGSIKANPKAVQVSLTEGEANLVALQNLLNAGLVETVKRNMGDGNSRSVLNLQSGRFAESVEVVRLSESRAGMITAFYRYMKNPYATFSQGGRQQTPRSRDPKLLISKSIRELATQQVGNRLRAVNI
jgi:hypothetical protein